MTNKNYEAGRAAENYIKGRLRERGVVVRAAGSKGDIDLVFFHGGHAWAIQVKGGKRGMNPARAESLWEDLERKYAGAVPFIVIYKCSLDGRYHATPMQEWWKQ